MNAARAILTRCRVVNGLLAALLLYAVGVTANDKKPDFSLANRYQPGAGTVLTDYWLSEKYDGARALWNGTNLISRGGKVYAAPAWFIAGLPKIQLDGELWLARGRFEDTMSVIRRQQPHAGWRAIRYRVFDLPGHSGTFRQRYAALLKLKATSDNIYWQVVEQLPIASAAALEEKYAAVLASGGEGLMLRRTESIHRGGRSDDLLKYKPFEDAEAVVIGHRPGQGKYTGMTGSLRVRTPAGVEFYVGSGLTDKLRKNPPPIGATISYKFQGLTANGKPRFPTFLRMRNDEPIPDAD